MKKTLRILCTLLLLASAGDMFALQTTFMFNKKNGVVNTYGAQYKGEAVKAQTSAPPEYCYTTDVVWTSDDNNITLTGYNYFYRYYKSNYKLSLCGPSGGLKDGTSGYVTVKAPDGYLITDLTIGGTTSSMKIEQSGTGTTSGGTTAQVALNWAGFSQDVTIEWSGTSNSYVSVDSIVVTYGKAYDIEITSAGYATLYYSDLDLMVPNDVKAITYKDVNDGVVEESKTYSSRKIIPAGEAVVLKGDEGKYQFVNIETESEPDENNILMGTDEDTETVGPDETKKYLFYKLSQDANETAGSVGFYWGANGGGAFTNAAHRAYLPVEREQAAGAKKFLFSDEGLTDGIQTVQTATAVENDAVYTLSGVRVSGSQLPAGIYIKNGKKFINK